MKKSENISKAKSPDSTKKRKNAEFPREIALETLHQSEERYRTILEEIQEGYFEVDLAGNFTFFNDSLFRYFGYSKEELMGMNYRQYTDKEHSKELFQAFNLVYSAGEQTEGFDWQIIRKDGTKRYVEASISLRKDSSGKPIGFRGIARDVTEQKKVEEALKKSEEQYRLLADNMTAHIWLMDLNTTKIIYVSPSVEKMYGYTPDEIIKLSLREILTAESVQKMLDAFSYEMPKVLANPLQYVHKYSLEMEACHKDGHLFWIEVDYSIIRDKNGKPTSLLGETRDINERKRAEEELRKSEENFRLSLDNSPLGVRIATIEADTIYANRAILDIYGYDSIDELNKTSVKERYTPQSYAEYEIRKKKRKLGEFVPSEYEISIVRRNGEIRNIQVYRKEVIWNGTKQSQVIYKDITEHKQAEEKLHETLENLRKSIKTTIQVLGTASEARDPYTAGHQKRVALLARIIATEMGFPHDTIEGILMAGSIHDIGRLSIPPEILSKPTKLTNIELSMIKEHSLSGYEMLKNVESPWPLAQIVYQHHERMNGSGYPRNLKGVEILIEARIMAVADVVEAMASHRPYRPALGIDVALNEIEKNRGILYDDTVVDACLRLFREKDYHLKEDGENNSVGNDDYKW
jgi:PAS domain S-box-containing protein